MTGLRRWDTDGGETEEGLPGLQLGWTHTERRDFTRAERKGRRTATLQLGSECIQLLLHVVSFWS